MFVILLTGNRLFTKKFVFQFKIEKDVNHIHPKFSLFVRHRA